MCGILALLFIAVPALEIYLLITIGQEIGAGVTLLTILITGIIGAWLARVQGALALNEVQQALAERREIGVKVAGALLVLVAAVLLVTPGFVTDGVGLLLLLPPIRNLLARRIVRYVGTRASAAFVVTVPPGSRPGEPGEGESPQPPTDFIDV